MVFFVFFLSLQGLKYRAFTGTLLHILALTSDYLNYYCFSTHPELSSSDIWHHQRIFEVKLDLLFYLVSYYNSKGLIQPDINLNNAHTVHTT